MRGLVFLVIASTLSGCSGMMMSGGTATSGSSAGSRSAGTQATTDGAITQHIRQLYRSDAVLREAALYVSTNKGIVSLAGSVPSYRAREDAEKLAISVDGVVSVNNKIIVE